jgi:hypothetical protein
MQWLFPWSEYHYPGQRKGFCMVTGGSLEGIRHWLAGRRALSVEARNRLIGIIEARLELGASILTELKAYQPPPKPPPGWQGARARRLEASKALDKP